MAEDQSQTKSGQETSRRIYWDWWRENPVELVLVILIIVLFVMVPWEGCGITEQDPDEPVEAQDVEVVP